MEIVTEEYASEYKDRAAKANQARTQYDMVPPSGTYVVVNTHMRREISGSKGTPCLVPTMRILKVVSVEKSTDQKEADGCVMHDVFPKLWVTPKTLAGIGTMAIAHTGNSKARWDTDKDDDVIKNLTGVPFLVKIWRKESTYEGKPRVELNINAALILDKPTRDKVTASPDFSKMVPPPASRMLPIKDWRKGRESSSNTRTSSSVDPRAHEEQPPMDDGLVPF